MFPHLSLVWDGESPESHTPTHPDEPIKRSPHPPPLTADACFLFSFFVPPPLRAAPLPHALANPDAASCFVDSFFPKKTRAPVVHAPLSISRDDPFSPPATWIPEAPFASPFCSLNSWYHGAGGGGFEKRRKESGSVCVCRRYFFNKRETSQTRMQRQLLARVGVRYKKKREPDI